VIEKEEEEDEEEMKEIKRRSRRRRSSAFEIAGPVQTVMCVSVTLFVCSLAILSIVFRLPHTLSTI